jgi:hypothetical protein
MRAEVQSSLKKCSMFLELAGGYEGRTLWSQSTTPHVQDGNSAETPGGHNRPGCADNMTAGAGAESPGAFLPVTIPALALQQLSGPQSS